MTRTLQALPVLLLAACSALPVPAPDTPYYREQLALSRVVPTAPAATEGVALREAAARLELRAASEQGRIRDGDETEGILDLRADGAREFVARAGDPAAGDSFLAATPLDLEHVLLAVHARNPDVAAARASWAAAVRMYEQATYLEDLLLRYAAFTRFAGPRAGAAPMREAAFPYPGIVALKGEMIDREVAMAREMARMRLLEAAVEAAKRSHEAVYREQEVAIRTEQVALAERVVAATRSRVESGRGPQAELLEMEADLAMARNDREQALAALARERGALNTLLARAPGAPLTLLPHADPPQETPSAAAILAAAPQYSPSVRIAQAESGRTAAAIRMSEAMLFAAPAPGAVTQGAPMVGADALAMPIAGDGGAGNMGGGMGGAGVATVTEVPTVAPRDAPPTGAPGAFGPDLAWVAELRERHAALLHAADEAALAARRSVIEAQFERDAARRMFSLASRSSAPLSIQAVEERLRLYEAGRGEFAELTNAIRRWLEATREVALARHEYGMAESMLWMAAGARPELLREGPKESGK